MQLSEQEVVRREKLVKLRALGINPYPADLFPINSNSTKIKQDFSEGKQVIIAGRLMVINIQGKASFAQLQDGEGRIQLYFNRDEICAGEDKTLYNDVFKKLLDLGDFIGITGTLFTTKVGEKTVMVKEFKLLSKALNPLPMPKVKDFTFTVFSPTFVVNNSPSMPTKSPKSSNFLKTSLYNVLSSPAQISSRLKYNCILPSPS
jgi:lysyl-tRNA synthetase class 2